MKHDIKVEVIDPLKRRGSTRCVCCNIQYDKENYELFFKLKKIVYFKLQLKEKLITSCDDCLIQLASLVCIKHRLESIKINVVSQKETKTIEINPLVRIDLTSDLYDIFTRMKQY